MFIRRRCVADFHVFRYEGPKSTYQTCKLTCARFQRRRDGRNMLTITRRRCRARCRCWRDRRNVSMVARRGCHARCWYRRDGWIWFQPAHRYRHLILHRRTKFYVKWTVGDLATTLCQFWRWRTSVMLYFPYGSGRTPTTCRWWFEFCRQISEILQFFDFRNMAWKCLLASLLVGLCGTFPQMMSLIVLTPWAEAHHLRNKAWRSAAQFELGVGSRKKAQYRTRQNRNKCSVATEMGDRLAKISRGKSTVSSSFNLSNL